MNISKLTTYHPVGFVIVLTIVWVVLLLVFMGVAATVFHWPYGGVMAISVGRLAVTTCVLFLMWRLDWLKASGIFKLGSWHVWLPTLGGMVYIASASLYAFIGKIVLDLSILLQQPDAHSVVITHFVAGLSEEILFRGLVLYALMQVWGKTSRGILGSVLLTAVLFALLHLTQVFTYGTTLASALVLVLQTFVISIWWGALVIKGGSIWPAVLSHFLGNAVVAVQGLTTPILEPGMMAFRLLLWFSLPLGVLAIGWLAKTKLYIVAFKVP